MLIGQLIGQQHLVGEAAEIVEIAIAADQRDARVHVHAVNVEILPTYALAQRRTDAHFVKNNVIQLQ
jgi:hypothetical protein